MNTFIKAKKENPIFVISMGVLMTYTSCSSQLKVSSSTGSTTGYKVPSRASKSENRTSRAIALKDKSEMTKCGQDEDKNLVYRLDTKEFEVCTNETWTTIDIRGEKGETGAQGPQGLTGATGGSGSGLGLNESYVWAYVSTSPAITASTETKISFDAEVVDKKNEFNTSNGLFTALESGLYRVEFNFRSANLGWTSSFQYVQTTIHKTNASDNSVETWLASGRTGCSLNYRAC